MTDAGWEQFPVEADVGIRGWGPTRAEAFARTTLGVLALVVDPAEVQPVERREVRAQGVGPEMLLASWISECLYVHEIEGFAVRDVEMTVCTDTMAHGLLAGELLDTARHRRGAGVKAVTMHGLAVERRPDRHEARVVVAV